MGGGGFDLAGPADTNTAQLALGPVDAGGADAPGQRGIIGDQQDQAAAAAGARERKAGGEARAFAKMAPDDAEAARQAFHDFQRIRRADGVGDEERAGQGAAGFRAGGFCKARGRHQLAAGGGLTCGSVAD